MKIGLKLWSPNIDAYLDAAKNIYQEKCFDYIELYTLPGNIDKISAWKKLKYDYGVKFGIHAPHFQHGMNLSKKEFFADNMKFYVETKAYADELEADYIIFHSGTDGDYKETARQLNIINDPRTIIENKPYKTLPFINGDFYVGGKVEEIRYIIETVGCDFCLDIGHAISSANAQGLEPYNYIEDFMSLNPLMYHLSDINIDSEMDEHLNYGTGTLDFNRVFKIIGYNSKITIETNKKSKTDLDDFKKDSNFLNDFVLNLK